MNKKLIASLFRSGDWNSIMLAVLLCDWNGTLIRTILTDRKLNPGDSAYVVAVIGVNLVVATRGWMTFNEGVPINKRTGTLITSFDKH